jgi:hypothetical protein
LISFNLINPSLLLLGRHSCNELIPVTNRFE